MRTTGADARTFRPTALRSTLRAQMYGFVSLARECELGMLFRGWLVGSDRLLVGAAGRMFLPTCRRVALHQPHLAEGGPTTIAPPDNARTSAFRVNAVARLGLCQGQEPL